MSKETEKKPDLNQIIETDKIEIKHDEKSGNKIINEFFFKETLGRGAYSKVKKCINTKTNQEFAVKVINNYLLKKKKKAFDKSNEGSLLIHYMIEDALNEIKTYKSLKYRHPNILSLYQILHDKAKDKTYLIMELAEKGPINSLNQLTGVFTLNENYDNEKYDEKLIKSWILDIATGIKFLHDNNIAHCDIKPDNVLIGKDGHCKLADFGNSLRYEEGDDDNILRTQGNIYFFPPEFVDEEKDKKDIDYKALDIWSFGITIYTCIFKSLPFVPDNKDNIMQLFDEINSAKFDFNKNGIKISEEMKTLLQKMLEKEPEKRFTANDIVNFPWLKNEE